MVLVYAVESWILSIVGWAWLSLRESALPRSFMDEFTLYAALGLSTANLLVCSLTPLASRGDVQRAFLRASIAVWLLYGYCILDSLPMPNTGSQYVPVNSSNPDLCCPNSDVPAMHRALFWGGFQWFLAPSAVTLAFQTLQVLTGAAGVATSGETAWPGASWGYVLGCLLCTMLFLRFAGVPRAPCPEGWFSLLQALHVNYAHVFAALGGGMFLLINLEGFPVSRSLSTASHVGGLVLVLILSATVVVAGNGRGMLTLPVFVLLAVIVAPVGFALLRPLAAQGVEPAKPKATRTRWVLPMRTSGETRDDKKSQ